MSDFKHPVGARITWKSRGRGRTMERIGVVLAHLPSGASALGALHVIRPGVVSDIADMSERDRYLVEAVIGQNPITGADVVRYLTPMSGTIDDGRDTVAVTPPPPRPKAPTRRKAKPPAPPAKPIAKKTAAKKAPAKKEAQAKR